MTLKTCLLITDDADDHQAFSEAISEIYEKAIVLIVIDSQKALDLLTHKKHLPDYIFLDLLMNGLRINSFFKTIKTNNDLQLTKIIVYGDAINLAKIDNFESLTRFNKEYEYSELRDFLKELIKD